MNRSITVNFRPGGELALALDEEAKGFQCTVQNALVNILADSGKDPIFPDRGTGLLRTALNSGIFDYRSATHACNFAAADTIFFSRDNEIAEAGHKMQKISLTPSFLNVARLDIQAAFLSVEGENISFPIRTAS